MIVYHYNQYGYFCGQDIADESPLEPGIFLIPALATSQEPPAPQEGKNILFVNGGWQLVDIVIPPDPIVPPITKAQQITRLFNTYDAERRQLERYLGDAIGVYQDEQYASEVRAEIVALDNKYFNDCGEINND